MIKILLTVVATVLLVISSNAQNALPPGKQAIEQLYLQERNAGSQTPAPRNPNASYPIVKPGPFQTGLFDDCDSFHGMIVSNCWRGLVNGLETQVYAGGETEDNDPQQGLVVLLQATANFVPTPMRVGAVHIISANGPVLTMVSATGPYVLTFDASTGQFTSLVLDNTPPVISGMPPAGTTLWPPNKKMVTVAIVTVADTSSGVVSFEITGTSSEPADPKNPDVVITGSGTGPRTVQLRADRLGTGNGRTYTLTATAVDGAGNKGSVTAT